MLRSFSSLLFTKPHTPTKKNDEKLTSTSLISSDCTHLIFWFFHMESNCAGHREITPNHPKNGLDFLSQRQTQFDYSNYFSHFIGCKLHINFDCWNQKKTNWCFFFFVFFPRTQLSLVWLKCFLVKWNFILIAFFLSFFCWTSQGRSYRTSRSQPQRKQ